MNPVVAGPDSLKLEFVAAGWLVELLVASFLVADAVFVVADCSGVGIVPGEADSWLVSGGVIGFVGSESRWEDVAVGGGVEVVFLVMVVLIYFYSEVDFGFGFIR